MKRVATKRKGERLHALVQALDKAEKRYVRLFSKMRGGEKTGHLIALFDLLLNMNAYDADQLQEQAVSMGIQNALPSLKSRLMELILAALRNLRSKSDVDSQLRLYGDEIARLQEKKQYFEAYKRLQKALILAESYERPLHGLQLLQQANQLHLLSPQTSDAAFFASLQESQAQLQALSQQHTTLQVLHARLRSLARQQTRNRAGQNREAIEQLIAASNAAVQTNPQGLLALGWHTDMQGMAHLLTGNYDAAVETYLPLLEAWKNRPELLADQGNLFLGIYSNFLNACLFTGSRKAEFHAALQFLREFKGFPPGLKFRYELLTYSQELLAVLHDPSFQKGNTFVENLEAWIYKNEPQISAVRFLSFCYNVCIFFFVHGHNRAAYHWLLKILHYPGRTERTDLRDFARIFQLILQFEFGDVDLNTYLLRSAHRYFHRTQKLQAFESAVLGFVRDALPSLDAAAMRQHYLDLQQQLEQIAADRQSSNPNGTHELLLWVESKLKAVSIQSLFLRQIE